MYVSISCSQDGNTAVLVSAAGGRLDLMRELVEQHGADLYHKSKVSSAPSVCDSECDSHRSCALVFSVVCIIPFKYSELVEKLYCLNFITWVDCCNAHSLFTIVVSASVCSLVCGGVVVASSVVQYHIAGNFVKIYILRNALF